MPKTDLVGTNGVGSRQQGPPSTCGGGGSSSGGGGNKERAFCQGLPQNGAAEGRVRQQHGSMYSHPGAEEGTDGMAILQCIVSLLLWCVLAGCEFCRL